MTTNPHDRDYCIVMIKGPYGPEYPDDYFPDAPLSAMTEDAVVRDIASGQIENVVAVFSFNPVKNFARDITEDVAHKVLADHLDNYGKPRHWVIDFLEQQLGCQSVAVAEREHRS